MNNSHCQSFSLLCEELCNLLYLKEYNKDKVNSLIDELNARPFKAELFARKHVRFLGYAFVELIAKI